MGTFDLRGVSLPKVTLYGPNALGFRLVTVNAGNTGFPTYSDIL